VAVKSPLDDLVTAIAGIPVYEDPLAPLYQAVAAGRPLTLRTVRQHSQLLQDCADQSEVIQEVIEACSQLAPTPLSDLPLGF
jgi:hypothetical protein